MARAFHLPDLGEGLTEAEIVKVLVSEGDVIREDTPLLEVETDKATVEIPSPMSGRVATIHVAPGQTVRVGAVLATVNLTSRYALKLYVEDQLRRIPWDLAVYQRAGILGRDELPRVLGEVPGVAVSRTGSFGGLPVPTVSPMCKPSTLATAKMSPAMASGIGLLCLPWTFSKPPIREPLPWRKLNNWFSVVKRPETTRIFVARYSEPGNIGAERGFLRPDVSSRLIQAKAPLPPPTLIWVPSNLVRLNPLLNSKLYVSASSSSSRGPPTWTSRWTAPSRTRISRNGIPACQSWHKASSSVRLVDIFSGFSATSNKVAVPPTA